MTNLIKKFRKSEDGATAIEYGLIAALVAIALITALNTLGTNLSGLLGGVSDTLEANTPAGEGGEEPPAP